MRFSFLKMLAGLLIVLVGCTSNTSSWRVTTESVAGQWAVHVPAQDGAAEQDLTMDLEAGGYAMLTTYPAGGGGTRLRQEASWVVSGETLTVKMSAEEQLVFVASADMAMRDSSIGATATQRSHTMSDPSPQTDPQSGKLQEAIRSHDIAKVRAVIALHPDMNEVIDGISPLHLCVLTHQATVAKLLLAAGANVDVKGQGGATPLYVAALSDEVNMIRLLLANGASIHEPADDDRTPLRAAVAAGNERAVKLLTDAIRSREK